MKKNHNKYHTVATVTVTSIRSGLVKLVLIFILSYFQQLINLTCINLVIHFYYVVNKQYFEVLNEAMYKN